MKNFETVWNDFINSKSPINIGAHAFSELPLVKTIAQHFYNLASDKNADYLSKDYSKKEYSERTYEKEKL